MRTLALSCIAIAALLSSLFAVTALGQENAAGLSALPEIELPLVDVATLMDEDEAGLHRARRVAFAVEVDLDLESAGDWTDAVDVRVWRLRVTSIGAEFLSFKLDEMVLPEGAELRFFSVDRDFEAGPFTSRHNRPERRFGSPVIPGDSVVVELRTPYRGEAPRLAIESVSHGYRPIAGIANVAYRSGHAPPSPLRGGPQACFRDVNCPEGDPYQVDKQAVAEGYDGQFICSGTLINNVRRDGRYLYLTAAHCEWWRDPAGMVYYWNYENSGCGTNDAPLTFSTGSTGLWFDVAADVHLLELSGTDLEGQYGIYFAGWDRKTSPPQRAATLGFPSDRPIQVAIENDPVTNCAPGGCPNGYGADFWRIEDWDVGTTLSGSSGGALLDERHLVVGVLTGGVGTNCNNFDWDEFAKLDGVFSSLQPYLDPDATGAMWISGMEPTEVTPTCQGVDAIAPLEILTDGSADADGFHVLALAEDPIAFFLDRPAAGGNGKFVAHLNAGWPTASTVTSLPAQLGDSCFPFLIPPGGTAAPSAVWNKIGKVDKVGASDFFGTPIPDPDRAPVTFYSRASIDTSVMPVGSRWTLQAVILNPTATSPKAASVTNAIVLEVL